MRGSIVTIAIVSMGLLPAACGGGGEYSDLLELRDAAADAGLDCSSWSRADPGEEGKQIGDCSDQSVVILYTDGRDASKEATDLVETLSGVGMPYSILVGDNWMINSPDAPDLQDDLGGEVMRG